MQKAPWNKLIIKWLSHISGHARIQDVHFRIFFILYFLKLFACRGLYIQAFIFCLPIYCLQNLQVCGVDFNPGQKSLGHQTFFLCFYYWLEIDSILCKITLSTPPLPSSIQCWSWSDAHATFLINFQHWTGWGWGGGLWIKLTSLNVQVSQHFWPGLLVQNYWLEALFYRLFNLLQLSTFFLVVQW